ncbi:MAG: hypothetical protein JSW08_01785 [archaeon]|nr:MAG: hypothetical protein JSW08_01785 [archaeon]
MDILEREVDVRRYGGVDLYNVKVKLKPGDCRKEKEPQYKCLDTCEGSFMIARFERDTPISVKALVPEEIMVANGIVIPGGLKTLEDFQRVSGISGY